jgi:hypothetical protein
MKMQETPLIGDASLLCRAAGLLLDLLAAAENLGSSLLVSKTASCDHSKIAIYRLINRFSTKSAELGNCKQHTPRICRRTANFKTHSRAF